MSQLCKDTITCPKCHKEGEFEYWSSINVDLDPELKEKIFNEEIFVWTCPECGAKVFIPFGTLYHDMKNQFMIFFSHENPEEDKHEPFEVPAAFGIEKGYTFRAVYGLMNFKEKIMIMEKGLNDIAVEKLKYTITHHMDENMAKRGVKLFFQGITKPDEENEYGQMVFYCLENSEDEESGNIALPMERYYEQCLSLELDKRFEVSGCMCIDEEWISIKMKGAE